MWSILSAPRTSRIVALAIALAFLPVTAHASAATANPCTSPRVTNFLAADASHAGTITLYFFHAGGAPVTYFECAGGRARRLGTLATAAGAPTILRDATTWSCDRLTRRFVATATLADGSPAVGTYSVRTRSCAQRFELTAPRRLALGATLAARVVDRWGIGATRQQLCIAPPHERSRCATLRFARAVSVATRRVRATTRGRWRVELRIGTHRLRAAVAVGGGKVAAPRPAPTLLATGDSMMQGIDGFLGDDLGNAFSVRSDVRPGTSIGKDDQWLRRAASQARRLRPNVTVVAIGANEGWPEQTPAGATVACCGEPWTAELARRVRTMMLSYERGGRGRVVWLTLPAPRDGRLTPIFAAVDDAVLRAATGLAGVTVLRQDEIFTPRGYRDAMRYRGATVRVREPDGVHLNVSGTAIAATAITRILAAH